jgi:hypothetical protein
MSINTHVEKRDGNANAVTIEVWTSGWQTRTVTFVTLQPNKGDPLIDDILHL